MLHVRAVKVLHLLSLNDRYVYRLGQNLNKALTNTNISKVAKYGRNEKSLEIAFGVDKKIPRNLSDKSN